MAELIYKHLLPRERELTAYMILHAVSAEPNATFIRFDAKTPAARRVRKEFCIHSAEYEKLRAAAKKYWLLHRLISDSTFGNVLVIRAESMEQSLRSACSTVAGLQARTE